MPNFHPLPEDLSGPGPAQLRTPQGLLRQELPPRVSPGEHPTSANCPLSLIQRRSGLEPYPSLLSTLHRRLGYPLHRPHESLDLLVQVCPPRKVSHQGVVRAIPSPLSRNLVCPPHYLLLHLYPQVPTTTLKWTNMNVFLQASQSSKSFACPSSLKEALSKCRKASTNGAETLLTARMHVLEHPR